MPRREPALTLLLLVLYYLTERCIKFFLRRRSISFFDYLYASHKLPVFTGIAMGALITAFITPSCMRAAFGLSSANIDTEICFTGRAILWVAELNRLDLYELYVVHHLGSLVALFSTVLLDWPYRPLLIILASLISEIPGDFLWLLSAHRDYRVLIRSSTRSDDAKGKVWNFHTLMIGLNLLQYTFIRFPAMGYAFWVLNRGQGTKARMDKREYLIACAMLIAHAAFCIGYVVRQYRALQKRLLVPGVTEKQRHNSKKHLKDTHSTSTWSVNTTHHPYHIRINAFGTQWFFTIYGIFMGLGLAVLTAAVTVLYPSLEAESIALVIIFAVLGARLFSLIFEDGLKQFFHSPLSTLLRPGFWLHGGIAGATLASIYLAYMDAISDIAIFGGSLAVGLPLFEFFSRIGCHCYGCCYGRPFTSGGSSSTPSTFWYFFPPVVYSHPSDSALSRSQPTWVGLPLIPIQIASAAAFFSLFIFLAVPLITVLKLSVPVAGCIVLIGHSLLRLITERYRSDYRGEGMKGTRFTTTGLMTLLQLAIGVSSLVWMVNTWEIVTTTTNLRFGKPSIKLTGFSFGLGAMVYGIHKGRIGRWL
ncbi:hypothetical protein E1B28_007317 [Marasmius oreades]|uniref:Uncharacterized protein n=1 Tax=Marasmius oreades TaxID=181124 RepID=A0A9P7S239_9AGAR|nr:uncharacterized protein E1B28_007317 [Marasmius oreades]KAG7093655.1 hypothetical protein E1B28_007317 [Marasmius oreades]